MNYLESIYSNIQSNNKGGFILLFTIVIISVTVGLSVSLLLSATRQAQLGSLQSEVQSAFYAADTGVECGLAWVYPAVPPTFSCAGMKPVKQASSNIKKDIYYFDYRKAGPSFGSWSAIDWTTSDVGGDTGSCGVVVITNDDTWTNLAGTLLQGYTIEGYGYSICAPGTGSLSNTLVPAQGDPNLIERKILVRVPVSTQS